MISTVYSHQMLIINVQNVSAKALNIQFCSTFSTNGQKPLIFLSNFHSNIYTRLQFCGLFSDKSDKIKTKAIFSQFCLFFPNFNKAKNFTLWLCSVGYQ